MAIKKVPATPPKTSSNSSLQKSKHSFHRSPVKSFVPLMPDRGHKVFVCGYRFAVMSLYIQKKNMPDTEAFYLPFSDKIEENPEFAASLNISSWCNRRDVNKDVNSTLKNKNSNFIYKQFVCILGSNEENTPDNRRNWAMNVIQVSIKNKLNECYKKHVMISNLKMIMLITGPTISWRMEV